MWQWPGSRIPAHAAQVRRADVAAAGTNFRIFYHARAV